MDVAFTTKLIQEVRNRPIIYLLSHPDYRNGTKTLEAWSEIQQELNVEVKILKAKWKNLKDTYKKFKQSRRSDSSQAARKLSKWAWAEHMNFIEPSLCLNETKSIKEEGAASEVGELNDSCSSFAQSGENEIEFAAMNELRDAPEIYPTNQCTHDRRSSKIDEKVEVKCDGIDLFFLGYSDTFKKLSKRRQVAVKYDIAKIFMEAELGDLQDTEDYSMISEKFSMASKSVL